MSDGYQMTGGIADIRGHITEIGHAGPVVVIIPVTGKGVMYLDAAKQEEFAQLYVAACHQAKVSTEAGRQAGARAALCPDCGQPGCPHQAGAHEGASVIAVIPDDPAVIASYDDDPYGNDVIGGER